MQDVFLKQAYFTAIIKIGLFANTGYGRYDFVNFISG